MQLPLTTDALVPVGAGVVVAIALVILILFAYRRNRAFHSRDLSGPSAAHWTRDSSNRAVQPAPATVLPPAAHAPAATAGGGPESRSSPDQAGTVSEQRMEAKRAGHQEGDVVTAGEPPPWAAGGTRAAGRSNGADDPAVRAVSEARALPPEVVGSSRTVAAAVAQAFAVRAANARRGGEQKPSADAGRNVVPPGADDHNGTPPVGADRNGRLSVGADRNGGLSGSADRNGALSGSADRNGGLSGDADAKATGSSTLSPPSTTRGDARDRLLAVLLDDPVRAVGATEELEACRSRLRDVMHRLAGTGLRPEQLARLAGLPVEDVHKMLEPAA
jgi:hypothetical protein